MVTTLGFYLYARLKCLNPPSHSRVFSVVTRMITLRTEASAFDFVRSGIIRIKFKLFKYFYVLNKMAFSPFRSPRRGRMLLHREEEPSDYAATPARSRFAASDLRTAGFLSIRRLCRNPARESKFILNYKGLKF